MIAGDDGVDSGVATGVDRGVIGGDDGVDGNVVGGEDKYNGDGGMVGVGFDMDTGICCSYFEEK